MKIMSTTIKIYVQLLEEGTDTARATTAVVLGNGLYKLLPTSNYDPEDEVWEFLPGSVVKCNLVKDADGEEIMLAVRKVS